MTKLQGKIGGVDVELETALSVLREALKYIECTDGTRGDFVGCAVSYPTYMEWRRIAEADPAKAAGERETRVSCDECTKARSCRMKCVQVMECGVFSPKPPVAQAGTDEGHTCGNCGEYPCEICKDFRNQGNINQLTCNEWTPQTPKGEDATESLGEKIDKGAHVEMCLLRDLCLNLGMKPSQDRFMEDEMQSFIRDLHRRSEELKLTQDARDMWSRECGLMCDALADLTGVPRDPRPGWQHSVEKIKSDLHRRAGESVSAPLPDCQMCGKHQTENGSILISPPLSSGLYIKTHICVECFDKLTVTNRRGTK